MKFARLKLRTLKMKTKVVKMVFFSLAQLKFQRISDFSQRDYLRVTTRRSQRKIRLEASTLIVTKLPTLKKLTNQ
jgi:hypothetical protein